MAKYKTLEAELRRKVLRAEYRERIPPERQLAHDHDVSVMTVKKAIDGLVADGLVYRRQGSGTYVASRAAEARRGTNVVAMLTRSPKTYHYPLMGFLADRLHEAGLVTMHLNPLDEDFRQRPAAEIAELLAYRPRAVVIEDLDGLTEELLQMVRSQVDRVVVIGRGRQRLLGASAVMIDVWQAWYLATRHLVDLGHEWIAMKGQGMSMPLAEARQTTNYAGFCGYRDALYEAGLAGRERLLLAHVSSAEFATETDALLAGNPPPTAFCCPSDFAAAQLIRVLGERGLRVPADVAVVGMGDTPWAVETVPPLTTVDFRYPEVARRAADLLIDPTTPDQTIMIAPELIVRGSCGPPPSSEVPS